MAKIRKITVDQEAVASYIYLEKIGPGSSKNQIALGGNLILDFGEDGSLLGIEVLDLRVTKDLKSKKTRKRLKKSGVAVTDL